MTEITLTPAWSAAFLVRSWVELCVALCFSWHMVIQPPHCLELEWSPTRAKKPCQPSHEIMRFSMFKNSFPFFFFEVLLFSISPASTPLCWLEPEIESRWFWGCATTEAGKMTPAWGGMIATASLSAANPAQRWRLYASSQHLPSL